MTDYLPEVYQHFSDRFPVVKEAFDALGAAEHEAGPLSEKERCLVKLGLAVGAESEAAVGFPATNAALGWAEEVLNVEARS
jgi:4-carboxymuconolactone decarboxylase